MKKILFTALTALTISQLSAQTTTPASVRTFTNPVIRGDVADPSIIRYDNSGIPGSPAATRYYATGTSSEWAPHYPVFESADFVNWRQTGHIFSQKPAWTTGSFWAPELFVNPTNGRVYCYYTARQKGSGISYIGVASADTPTGEFTDHGPIIEYGTESIDAFVWADTDPADHSSPGQLYISWKAYGLDSATRPIEILGSRLSADGLRLEGDPFTMLRDDEGIGMEGQWHFRRHGWWYIVYAARGCCGPGSDYEVWVARSRDVRGPYEKHSCNPILFGGSDFLSCGHGTGVETPDGRVFYLCHAYQSGAGFYLGRQPILQELLFDSDGWPWFAGGRAASGVVAAPALSAAAAPALSAISLVDFSDDFNELRPEWTWNFPWSDVRARIDDGHLELTGTPFESNSYGSVLCLRARSTDYAYQTTIARESASVQGLTMYGDAGNLVIFGVRGQGSDRTLFVRVVDNGTETTLHESAFPASVAAAPLRLRISVTDGCVLSFAHAPAAPAAASPAPQDWVSVLDAPVDCGGLVRWDRVARPGLIHIGPEEQPARFSDFRMSF